MLSIWIKDVPFRGIAARVIALLLACLCVGSASAQQHASCLNDIERLMREFQARYYEIAKTNPDLPANVVDWPPCCPSEKAPAFPPDGYYSDVLSGNPAFATELMKALQKAMCGGATADRMNILGYFNVDNRTTTQKQNGTECDDTPGATLANLLCDPSFTTPDSICLVAEELKDLISKMKVLRTPQEMIGGLSGVAKGACGITMGGSECAPTYQTECALGPCYGASCSSCSGVDEERSAYGVAVSKVSCAWNQASNVWSTSNAAAEAWDKSVVQTGSTGSTAPYCAGTWATSSWFQRRGTYSLNRMDVNTPWHVFFKFARDNNGQMAQPDSKYRQGNMFGLPISYCRWADTSQPDDWICYPPGALTLSSDRTIAGFGTDAAPKLYLDETNFPGDGCTSSNTSTVDLPGMGPRGWAINGIAAMATPDFNDDPERGRDCGSGCSTCVQDRPRAVLGSVDFSWSLGRRPDEKAAGYVLMRAREIKVRPEDAGLAVTSQRPDPVIRSSRLIRNIKVSSNDFSNDLRNTAPPAGGFGPISTFAAQTDHTKIEVFDEDMATNPYHMRVVISEKQVLPNGAYASAWTVRSTTHVQQSWSFANGLRQDVVSISQELPGQTTRGWEYSLVGGVWKLREGVSASNSSVAARSQEEEVLVETLPNLTQMRTTTRRTRNTDGTLCIEDTTVEQKFAWGWEVVSHSRPGEPAEIREYFDSASNPPTGSLGKLSAVTAPSGRWTQYFYDARGNITKTVSQFKASLEPITTRTFSISTPTGMFPARSRCLDTVRMWSRPVSFRSTARPRIGT